MLRLVEVAQQTAEVDVVGVSLGGLVARYAAAPREDGPRLRVANLYSISSPHRGARMASVPSWEPRVKDMRTGSDFLSKLDACGCGAQIVPYVRLDDSIVGVENSAPTGMTPWWVATPPMQASHLLAHTDPRILADIARRLRGEEPFTHEPAAPLPDARSKAST
jgi:pimeloyl-ACP methyl ester carboxylesterase